MLLKAKPKGRKCAFGSSSSGTGNNGAIESVTTCSSNKTFALRIPSSKATKTNKARAKDAADVAVVVAVVVDEAADRDRIRQSIVEGFSGPTRSSRA